MTIEGHRSHTDESIGMDTPPRHKYGGIRPQKPPTEEMLTG